MPVDFALSCADKCFLRAFMLDAQLRPSPPSWAGSVRSVRQALLDELSRMIQEAVSCGASPADHLKTRDDLLRLGEPVGDLMLRNDIAHAAHRLTGRPILILTVPGRHPGNHLPFDMEACIYGDFRDAMEERGLPLDEMSIFLLTGMHYSLLVPSSDVHLGFEPSAYPSSSFIDPDFGYQGNFTFMDAGVFAVPLWPPYFPCIRTSFLDGKEDCSVVLEIA